MGTEHSTVVLVHGAWRGSWISERVVPLLEVRGFSVRTVDLPSVGAAPSVAADLAGDAAAVAAVLDQVDGPVLLCGQSYGGMVISVTAAGRAGVARLVYLCAFMPEAGESLVQLTGGKPAPWIQFLDGGLTLPDPVQSADVGGGVRRPGRHPSVARDPVDVRGVHAGSRAAARAPARGLRASRRRDHRTGGGTLAVLLPARCGRLAPG
jgi:pimeloyl-ACP methyl ester carboxylesterase